ncbi:MAG: hypothetical protein FJ137_18195, partial [Deltaproteobacteria bacterium]|nr:hypothetical protein [Deltaproteobacteria bacterium]
MRVLVAIGIIVVGLLGAEGGRAGYLIEQEAVIPNPVTLQPTSTTVRTWHDGRRFKREHPLRNEVVVIDLDKHEVVGLNPAARTYWKLPAERYRQLALVSLLVLGVTPKPDGSVDVPDPLFVPTGAHKLVAGRDAYQVKVEGKLPEGVQTELWLSEVIPLTTEVLVDQLRMALGDPKHPSFQQFFGQWRALKGYPVQSVTTLTTPLGRIVTSETLSTREQAPS